MKRYIILIALTLSSLFCVAQEDEIVPLTSSIDEDIDKIYYYKDTNGDLNKFLGTWKYEDANKELILVFYLNIKDENGMGDFYDKIYAKFKYTENGTVIYNTLLDNSESSKLKITGSSFVNQEINGLSFPNLNKMSLFYNEPTDIAYRRSPYQQAFIEYLPCTGLGCSPQLKWDIKWLKNRDTDVWPFKIPKDLTLIKQ